MFSKQLAIIVAVVLFSELTFVHGQSHVINDCLDPGDNPIVLYDMDVVKAGFFLQTQEQTLRIPLTGFTNNTITCLTVINLDSVADGGYPKIIEGGVGYTYVILNLKSQYGKGFNFRVTAYN